MRLTNRETAPEYSNLDSLVIQRGFKGRSPIYESPINAWIVIKKCFCKCKIPIKMKWHIIKRYFKNILQKGFFKKTF